MDKKQRAETILRQFGGRRFAAMTGARNFLALDAGLQFSIPRTNGIRKVRVMLQPNDLYTVEFYGIHKATATLKGTHADVYGDHLPALFTEATGLHTSL
jgi:hypothetical protein